MMEENEVAEEKESTIEVDASTLQDLIDIVKDLQSRFSTIEEQANGLATSYTDAVAKFDHDQKRNAWDEKYGEKLNPYADKIKVLKGDDSFDLLEEAMNEYDKDFSDIDSDTYVDSLVENIKNRLDSVKSAFAEPEVQEVVEEVVEEAKAEVEEAVSEECSVEPSETVTTETDVDGDGEPDVVEVEEKTIEEDSDPEEDEFVARLEEEMKHIDKKPWE